MVRSSKTTPLATVYLVAIDDQHGRRIGKATIDREEAAEWAAIHNDFSKRGRFGSRATVVPCEARPQRAAKKSARRAAVA